MALHSPKIENEYDESMSLPGALRGCFATGILVVNTPGEIVSCTPEAGRLLRLFPDFSRTGQQKQLPAALLKIIREAASTGKTVTNRIVKLPAAGKNAVTLHVSAMPVPTGKSRCVVVMLNDLSTARQAEQNLARLDRLAGLGTFSASMAHEIKNALVSVKTFVDLLLEKNHDDELAEVVRREMRRIDAIVGQMLKYAGPSRSAFSAVRVHDVLDHSLRMVQPQIEGRLISLQRAFNAAPDAIHGDDYQLEQVFVNLLLNAIEAMGTNGSLTVTTDLISTASARPRAAGASGSHVRIAIADTGIGITTENMNRLFEPFFTTKQQGTGLGLAIARRIVQEHHGDISVQSQVNQGTTFSILLPVHAKYIKP